MAWVPTSSGPPALCPSEVARKALLLMPGTLLAMQDPVLGGETGCENISVTHDVLPVPMLSRDDVVN